MDADPYVLAEWIGEHHGRLAGRAWPDAYTPQHLLLACTGQQETGEDFDDLPGLCDAYEDAASR